MSKSLIITVDTEGEGGWFWKPGDVTTTENAKCVNRFQRLCDKYGIKPVYLTTYEMANNDEFMSQLIKWESEGRCEIGIHLHAWNNPPMVALNRIYDSQDYLIEYQYDIMREKFLTLYNILTSKIGHSLVSHRAGRWAMDKRYFNILKEFNIKVDCSFTPGINWSLNYGAIHGGPNYTNVPQISYYIDDILEVPMSIRKMHILSQGSFRHKIGCLLKGKNVWLRPAGQSEYEMKRLIKLINSEKDSDYLEFMIHSSELMPGGSPYFSSHQHIEDLFKILDNVFKYAIDHGYRGCTLKEYYHSKINM